MKKFNSSLTCDCILSFNGSTRKYSGPATISLTRDCLFMKSHREPRNPSVLSKYLYYSHESKNFSQNKAEEATLFECQLNLRDVLKINCCNSSDGLNTEIVVYFDDIPLQDDVESSQMNQLKLMTTNNVNGHVKFVQFLQHYWLDAIVKDAAGIVAVEPTSSIQDTLITRSKDAEHSRQMIDSKRNSSFVNPPVNSSLLTEEYYNESVTVLQQSLSQTDIHEVWFVLQDFADEVLSDLSLKDVVFKSREFLTICMNLLYRCVKSPYSSSSSTISDGSLTGHHYHTLDMSFLTPSKSTVKASRSQVRNGDDVPYDLQHAFNSRLTTVRMILQAFFCTVFNSISLESTRLLLSNQR